MAETYKLIPEISPTQRNWKAKVIVAEKMSPRQAKHGSSRYQNIVLMDFQGNKVNATLYDGNIQAFENQLLLAKTYIISNAFVRETKPEYKSSTGEFQWTISGKTKVEEVQESNMEYLFSKFTFTPFDQLENFLDSNKDITILAVVLNMRPKRLIQTRFGTQTYVQDILLTDQSFHTVILTMWDSFVDSECIILAENIAKKPVILATHLKVSSFNGLTLSTKTNSTFFIDAAFHQVAQLRNWIESNNEELNEIAHDKSHLALTPTKLTPPSYKRITQIQNLKGRVLGRKHYWVQAKPTVRATKQTFWYMSCDNCNRITHAEFGEMFTCIYCKFEFSVAVPRANANIQLHDATGFLHASAIGETAESILNCKAQDLMNLSKSETPPHHGMIHLDNEEKLFYLKVTELEQNTTQYKYEIVFVLDAIPALPDITSEGTTSSTGILCLDAAKDTTKNGDSKLPSAKRALFEVPIDPQIPIIKPEAEDGTLKPSTDRATGKRKLD